MFIKICDTKLLCSQPIALAFTIRGLNDLDSLYLVSSNIHAIKIKRVS
jgi:hypothetical protein